MRLARAIAADDSGTAGKLLASRARARHCLFAAGATHGSDPSCLLCTGRGGSGSPDAKPQQQEIVRLLEQHGVTRSG